MINAVLNGAHGLRLAILVNEFGELGIDGALTSSAAASLVEVPNGCICCSGQGDLGRGLAALLEVGDGIDGVLIETSGLTQPLGVVDIVNGPRFSDKLYLEAIVTVVDAANFDANLDNAVVAYQQLVAADLFLVNKVDLVSEEVVEAIEGSLSRLNPSAAVVRGENGAAPVWLLGQGDPEEASRPARSRKASERVPGPDVDSVSHHLDAPVDRRRFEAWAAALPRNAWRVKALLQFNGGNEWFSYHRVGARESLAVLAEESTRPAGRVVVIGRNLDGPSLVAGLRRCHREEVRTYAGVS